MDMSQTQTTVAVDEIIEPTRPPLSEMDNSGIKRVHHRTKDRTDVQQESGLERGMYPKE